MKPFIALLICLIISCEAISAKINMSILLDSSQTAGINIIELPQLGLATPLGDDSVMIIDNNMPVIHVKNFADANNFIATDSSFYYSVDNFIYSIDPASGEPARVAVLDNDRFSLYPAVGNSFFAVTSDDIYSRCQLFDPINKVYSDVLELNNPIYKVVANDNHVIIWAGDNLLLVGNHGKIATLITEPSIRDFVLTDRGIIFADNEGLYLMKSVTELKRLTSVSVLRLWYVADILYGLTESGQLFAIYEE